MIFDYLKPIIDWLNVHPHLGQLFVFAIAYTESLAILGAIVPGSVTLTAIGALIGAGKLPVIATFTAAILGAILGDLTSYWAGHHYHETLKSKWPISAYPALIDRGEQFFLKHGGKSIFLGRFIGPIRAILPLIAGMLNMPFWRFMLAEIVSGLCWAPAYLLPGILLGAATVQMTPEAATHLIVLVLLALVMTWLFASVMHNTLMWCLNLIDKKLQQFWEYINKTPRVKTLAHFIQNPVNPQDHTPLNFLLISMICAFLFLILTYEVIMQGLLTQWNEPLFYLLQSIRYASLDSVMVAVSILFEKKVLLGFTFLIAIWFASQHLWRELKYWLLNAFVSGSILLAMKTYIPSVRPPLLVAFPDGFSFPSGHVGFGTAILGFWTFLVSEHISPDLRSILYWILFPIIFLVAFARVYLGAHWITDVIGGFLLSVSIICLFRVIYKRKVLKPLKLGNLIFVGVLSLSFLWSWYFYVEYKKEFEKIVYPRQIARISYNTWWEQTKPLLPIYRKDRFGKPTEPLNIQWASSEERITQALEKRGWKKITKPNIYELLNRIVAKDKSKTLPFFSALYHGQKPRLVFIKQMNGKPIMMLHLWKSDYEFEDRNTHLWIGNINYRLIWENQWMKANLDMLQNLEYPISFFSTQLSAFSWRKVSYPSEIHIHQFPDSQHHIDVLLIKEH